jgi:hypothetical protein
MALKIIGRTPRTISENRTPVMEAKQIRLICPHCKVEVYVTMPYKPTPEQRQQLTSKAIDEHRRLCTQASAEAGRVYEIQYPRT